ncbi:putative HTH-type transcriptional regulator YwnA [Methanosarcinaceae archaeon Ag5]|uniref:HTH-type transcriptional regulator YwnA n=1 Tax=Methanolapillus africanus TaxID=3028297 RepID=A0AAE4MJ90_9EURY|nr:putative HTH-type transcriptional regulator YwnA [Methanosarcinaceae archaeon Ag5]
MQIASRFSIAIHTLLCVALLESRQKMTSEFISSCVNVNPAVIRKTLGQLKKAGIVDVKSGEGGATLAKPPNEITLFDVYQAVEAVDDSSLFNVHRQPDENCPLACPKCNPGCQMPENCEDASGCCYIHTVIDEQLQGIQKTMENSLKEATVQSLIDDLSQKVK